MPFEKDTQPIVPSKSNLKQVSSQKSMFDAPNKKITQQDFDKKVNDIQDKVLDYKKKVSDLALKFKKIIDDKTLRQNKSIFANELEQEVLADMINLGVEINNDPNEKEGMGSMSWITMLLKQTLSQRDRINELEYEIFQLKKK